jgi:hypothetical protein
MRAPEFVKFTDSRFGTEAGVVYKVAHWSHQEQAGLAECTPMLRRYFSMEDPVCRGSAILCDESGHPLELSWHDGVPYLPDDLAPAHESVLLEAENLINGDRAKSYGPPEDNYRRISGMCAASERPRVRELTPADIAYVMILTKLARESNAHKRDNQVDGAAYFDIYERLS